MASRSVLKDATAHAGYLGGGSIRSAIVGDKQEGVA